MTKLEALQFYGGSVTALTKALSMDQSSYYSWGEYPPGGRQLQLERLSGGALKAEPNCMQRPKKTEREARA